VSTPEEFLAQQAALREMAQVMGPLHEMLATLKRGFMEDAGLGPDAADDLVVTMAKMYVFQVLPIPPASE
jgi:hypothetical protein